MKRFYKLVSHRRSGNGYAILLDGKPVKTPAKAELTVQNEKLADALVSEWAAQDQTIRPQTMPLSQIVITRIDRIAQERPAITETILKYLDTDLICYRANHPPALAARQIEIWDPHLVWFAQNFGVPLLTTTDLKALKQPASAHENVRRHVEHLDDDRFTVLQLVTALSGSLILGLALTARALDAESVFQAMRIEESFNAEIARESLHGPDPAQSKKDAEIRQDLEAAVHYLSTL